MVHLNGLYLPESILDDVPDRYRDPYPFGRRAIGDATWVHQHGLVAQSRSETLTKPYAEQEWVYACVKAIALNLGCTPLRVNRGSKADPTRAEDGPLVRLMNEPSKNAPGEQFWQAVVSWMQLSGEGFILPVSADGKPLQRPMMPASLEIAAPSSVEWIKDKGAWEFKDTGGKRHLVDPQLVIQPKLWNPYDERRGMSPLRLASIAGEPLYQANLFNAALLRNNADPGGIIKFPKKAPNQETLDRMRANWNERHQGPAHAGMPAWMSEGAEFEYAPRTHRDMQFMELQAWGRDAICAIYGVPKGLLTNDDLNYATAVTQERAFWTRTLIPLGRLITGWLNAWLARAGVKEWVSFDTSGVEALQQSRAERIDEGKGLMDMGWSASEVNEALDLGMPDDTDSPWRREAWTQGTSVPFGAILPPEGEEDSGAVGATVQEQAMNGAQVASLLSIVQGVTDGTLPAGSAVEMLLVAFPTLTPEQAAAIVGPAAEITPNTEPEDDHPAPPAPVPTDEDVNTDDQDRRFDVFHARTDKSAERRGLLQEYQRGLLLKQEHRISRVALRYLRGVRKDVMDMVAEIAGSRTPGLQPEDVERIAGLRAKWDRDLAEKFGPDYWRVMEGAAEQVGKELGSAFTLDRTDPRWLELHGERIADMVQVNSSTVHAIRSTLIDGISSDENLADLRKRLNVYFARNPSRAFTIARTETGMLASGTRYETMQDAGVGAHEWVTSGDDVVRESHMEVDGEVVDVGTPFRNGLLYPHDPSGDAGNIVNCRCDAVAAD